MDTIKKLKNKDQQGIQNQNYNKQDLGNLYNKAKLEQQIQVQTTKIQYQQPQMKSNSNFNMQSNNHFEQSSNKQISESANSSKSSKISAVYEDQYSITKQIPILNRLMEEKAELQVVDENLEFKYLKLLEVIQGNQSHNKVGYYQQKLDYLLMVANRLQISLFDLLNLLPSKSLSHIFRDYKLQENIFVKILLASNIGLSLPNKIFEDIRIDINDKIDLDHEYYKAHSDQVEDEQGNNNQDDDDQEELTPQIKTRIFFSKYIIPQVLHQLIDFKQDPQNQMLEILGKLEDLCSIYSQNSMNSQRSYQPSQESNSSAGQSQNSVYSSSQHVFHQKVYITNLKDFYSSLGFFMEKIYRKHKDKAQYVLQYLQRICKFDQNLELNPVLLSYDNIKRDKIVLYRLAMSGTKKLLFIYLQDKQVLTKFSGTCIFNFKKKEVFLDYYKKFITPIDQDSTPDDTIFRISANLENYCRALQTSQHKICGLRNAIALIRFLIPFVDTFSQQFNASATYKYLLRAVCWRIVRFILFMHDGNLSYVALVFLIFQFDLLFQERSLLYQEHDRFLQLIFAFLYVNRNRKDKFFEQSQETATKIIKKLLRKITQKSSLNSSLQQTPLNSKNKTGILKQNETSEKSQNLKDYWSLNYNYQPLDVHRFFYYYNIVNILFLYQFHLSFKYIYHYLKLKQDKIQKEYDHLKTVDLDSKYSSIEKELKQIQEQPLVDEQVLLILAYLKNLLLKEPQDIQNYKLPKHIVEELKTKNLNEQQVKKEKEKYFQMQDKKRRQKKNAIFLHLLNLPKLSDNKKILSKNTSSMNIIIKLKQELLVDCLGLLGPVNQLDLQDFENRNTLPINLTTLDLKEKIKGFLNVNIFNTDIPLVSLCICKEYVENKFMCQQLYFQIEKGKRKKLNERIQNNYKLNLDDSKLESEDEEKSNGLNTSLSSKAGNGAQNLDYSVILQSKQPFNLMQWLAELIMKMKKQDEMIKIIEGCIELMANSDLGEFLTPYILFKYLNYTENSHFEIIPVINKILEEGHANHKLIITRILINLDIWFRQELKEEKQQNYDPFKPQSIMHSEYPKNKFIRNFAFIKKGISTSIYCKTLVEISEHKRAIHALELELEQQEISSLNITDPSEQENQRKIRTHYVYQLYNIYKEVNEDYKNIDGLEMMKKLLLDEAEIKKYQDLNLKQKNDGLCPEIYDDIINKPFRDEESQQKLINLLSKSIPDFAQQNQDFAFQKYLRCICWGLQKILNFEKNNSFDNMYSQLKSAIQKLKYAFSLQLVNARSCQDSKFSVLVKIQVLVNVENILKIQKFLKDNNKYIIELAQGQNLYFEQSSFSLDESQPDFILKLTPIVTPQGFKQMNEQDQPKRLSFNAIVSACFYNISQILQTLSKIQLSYDQECYLRIVYNYLICILYNQCKQFRYSYLSSLFKLSNYYYKKGKYQESQVVMKRGKTVWKERKEIYSAQEIYLLQAKIEKKLGNIKKAIHKLQKFDGIEFKIKKTTYKFQHNFQIFSDALIHQEFSQLIKNFKDNEKLYFKYAKFIDENELISDYPNDKEIDQKIYAIQFYLAAAKNGHQYIHQSLPRAIRLLVELFQDVINLQTKNPEKYKQDFNQKFKTITEMFKEIQVYKLTSVVNQLTSHITLPYETCANLFIELLAKVAATYPHQSVWWLLPLSYMYQLTSPNYQTKKDSYTEQRAKLILSQNSSTIKLESILLKPLSSMQLILPKKEYIFPQMPSKYQVVPVNYNPYHPEPVYMEKLLDNVRIMTSKQKPKLLTVQCSDQTTKKFLIKSQPQTDNINEQRTSELISFLNQILSQEQLGIYEMPSYSVLRLNSTCCLVEWVEDTLTIKSILEEKWKERKQKSLFNDLRVDRDKLHKDEWSRQKKLPSVFQDFFNQRFLDSQQWFFTKDNYIKTYASWCIFCYLLGLGDRHTDNILINKMNGEIIHIDYGLIFGQGKQLNVPETIPFRLTKNMEFTLGAFKSNGLFRKAMIDICLSFSKHLDDIIGFWDCFNNELEGNRKTNFNQLCNQIKNRIKMTNFKSTEEGIDSLIQIAKDDYCLRDMYKGWWPHA